MSLVYFLALSDSNFFKTVFVHDAQTTKIKTEYRSNAQWVHCSFLSVLESENLDSNVPNAFAGGR